MSTVAYADFQREVDFCEGLTQINYPNFTATVVEITKADGTTKEVVKFNGTSTSVYWFKKCMSDTFMRPLK
jgi:hypothetical protein